MRRRTCRAVWLGLVIVLLAEWTSASIRCQEPSEDQSGALEAGDAPAGLAVGDEESRVDEPVEGIQLPETKERVASEVKPAPKDVEITAAFGQPVILPNMAYDEKNFDVTVSGDDRNSVPKVRAVVVTGDVQVDGKDATIVDLDNGKGNLALTTGAASYFVIELTALDSDGKPVTHIPEDEEVPLDTQFFVGRISEGYESSFLSDRVASDLFLGFTYANEYDEQGINGAFGQAAPLARLTFDTMWHPGIRESNMSSEGRPSKGSRRYATRIVEKDGIEKEAIVRGAGLIHTGLEIQFADFPFGDEGKEVERNDSFTGSLYLLYQPDRVRWMASYTDTAGREQRPWDAVRFGVFAKAGLTTRLEQKPTNRDHDVARYAVGLKMTHHQTAAPSPLEERKNYLPMRFLELSAVYFEEWPVGELESNQWRLVIDGGIRLAGLGSEIIPFYGGIHANVGEGSDDLRVFAGFVFQIDEIVRLFNTAAK